MHIGITSIMIMIMIMVIIIIIDIIMLVTACRGPLRRELPKASL